MRRGVTWHDGTPFTAADVAFQRRIRADLPPVDLIAPCGIIVAHRKVKSERAPQRLHRQRAGRAACRPRRHRDTPDVRAGPTRAAARAKRQDNPHRFR
nr:hypothetical protein [Methylobacterium sp. 17Sr1-1]